MATTTTTTKHRQGTLFGFPVWAWVAIAVIFAITATILTVALTRGTPVDPAAEQAIAAEREAAIERSIAAATERHEGLAEYYADLEREAAIERSVAAATERHVGLAEYYADLEREAAIERSIAAATERLTAQAWAYVLANPEAVADVSRLPVPASQVTGMTEEQLVEIAGLVALVNQAADQGR